MERKNKKEKFEPKPGQTDYTNARWAPVVNCVLEHQGKILIIRRSLNMDFYPGLWSGVAGFLDDEKSLEEKAKEELEEELGINEKDIKKIEFAEVFDQDEPKYKKTWVIHPVLVRVKKKEVKLDWEAEDCRWIDPKDAKSFDLSPGFDKVLEKLSILKNHK
jgi:ADP-ribose pyrophosphatase YjhB (NUDIX family)